MGWPPIPDDWITAEVLASSELNALFDALQYLDGGWESFTPAWDAATTSPSIGNGTLTGKFLEMGGSLHVQGYLLAGTTTSAGSGQWTFGLPPGASMTNLNQIIHAGLREETLNNNYPAFATPYDSTNLTLGARGEDWLADGDLFSLNNGDAIWWGGILEID